MKENNQINQMELKKNILRIKSNPLWLKNLNENYCDNEEIVSQAVMRNGMALEYASARLKNNKKIVMLALEQTGWSIVHAGEDVRNDKQACWKALKDCPYVLKYAGANVRSDIEFAIKSVKKNSEMIKFVSDELKSEESLVLEALNANGSLFWHLKSFNPDIEVRVSELMSTKKISLSIALKLWLNEFECTIEGRKIEKACQVEQELPPTSKNKVEGIKEVVISKRGVLRI